MQRVPVDEAALVIPLYDSGLDVAVVRMTRNDDGLDEGLWWMLVTTDIEQRPSVYELPGGVPVPRNTLGQHTAIYNLSVLLWARQHIQQPTWRWFDWEPTDSTADLEPPDWRLTSSLIPREGWWQGALVTLKGYTR